MSNQPKVAVSGIMRKNGKYLLGRRNPKDTKGGMWVTPGGGVEFSERLNDALIREFKEETNLPVTIVEGFNSIQQSIHDEQHTVMVFKEVDCYELDRARFSEELVVLNWFTFRQIQDLRIKNAITDMTYNAIWDFYFFKRV